VGISYSRIIQVVIVRGYILLPGLFLGICDLVVLLKQFSYNASIKGDRFWSLLQQRTRRELERADSVGPRHPEYRYSTEFQSHEPEVISP
jgi:hypothetical protein